MQPTNNIGFLLNHTAFMLSRQSDLVLQERLDIGFSQFKILMTLKWNPSVKQKQIADRLGQTEASISRQIKLLHDKGLLNTRIAPENKRVHITTLTAKGERLTEKSMEILNKFHAPTFARLSEKEQQNLTDILNKMHDAVCVDRRGGFSHP